MKKLIIPIAILTCISVSAQDKNINAITSNDVANMTNAPVINSVGQNTTVQVNQNDHEQVEDLKCPLPTLSATGGYNTQQADNNYNNYRTQGDGANIIIGFSMPIGAAVKCGDLFKAKMIIVENNILDAKVGQCLKWSKMGYTINRSKLYQLNLITQQQNKSLQFCEYITKVEEANPVQFNKNIQVLQQNNLELKQKLQAVNNTPAKKVVKGHREYRIRFKDWVSGCNTGCNGEYRFIKDYISYIRDNSPNGVNIYAEPYGDNKVSVYVRGGWLSYQQANNEMKKYIILGLPAKVLGVKGTEIYK